MANILNTIDSSQTKHVWKLAKEIRWNNLEKIDCTGGQFSDNDMRKNTLNLMRSLNISELSMNSDPQNIPEHTFKETLNLFTYLNFCPEEIFHSPWTKLTRAIISDSSLDIMVLFLNRVLVKNEKSWPKLILKKILNNFEFKYETIDLVAKGLFTEEDEYEWNLLHEVSNHPVHIMKDKGKISPSSFIPYCYFGIEADTIGLEVKGLEFPVCNIFQAKVLNDQLCYEVDINDMIKKGTSEKDLNAGLTLLVDYNEDRTIALLDNHHIDDEDKMMIYIHSIGKIISSLTTTKVKVESPNR